MKYSDPNVFCIWIRMILSNFPLDVKTTVEWCGDSSNALFVVKIDRSNLQFNSIAKIFNLSGICIKQQCDSKLWNIDGPVIQVKISSNYQIVYGIKEFSADDRLNEVFDVQLELKESILEDHTNFTLIHYGSHIKKLSNFIIALVYMTTDSYDIRWINFIQNWKNSLIRKYNYMTFVNCNDFVQYWSNTIISNADVKMNDSSNIDIGMNESSYDDIFIPNFLDPDILRQMQYDIIALNNIIRKLYYWLFEDDEI